MLTRRTKEAIQTDKDDERRITCRYPAAAAPLLIGWWLGEEFKTTEIAIRDISLSGASAVTKTPPPDSAPIWLRLNDPAQPDWVEANVVAITTRFWGPALVRMKFREPCPYVFFKAVLDGLASPKEAGRRNNYWGGRYWD